jgi:signal peptide peptidase SppA
MLNKMKAIYPGAYHSWADQASGVENIGAILARTQTPEAAERLTPRRKSLGDIAVIPVAGEISQKPTIWTELFGGTSSERLVAAIRGAVQEPTVGAVVLDVDSPGGSVFGLAEAASAIRELRGSKPILAVANPVMASAAYYLAAQADEIVATPSSLVGSIGTIAIVPDPTELYNKAGIRLEVFHYGERKAETMPPLDDAGRDAIQSQVDYYGRMFEADVAAGRGVSRATIRAKYGRGAIFNADEALSAGLVDRIATRDEMLSDLMAGRRPKPRMAAQADAGKVEIASWRLRMGLTAFARSVD